MPKGSRTGTVTIAAPARDVAADSAEAASDPYLSQRISYRIANASPPIRDLFDSVFSYLTSLGDDVQSKELKITSPSSGSKTSCASRFTRRSAVSVPI